MAWRGPVKPVTNQAPNRINHGPEMSEMKKDVPTDAPIFTQNRAYQMRRDKDKDKNFSVNLVDIDTTILSYLDGVINPTIVDSGRQVKVPINYASPERWKAIRKDGYIRDKHGKMQCPAIAFRRTTIQRNDQLLTLNRYLQYPVVKQFSEKNKYDKFSLMTGFNKVKEIHSVALPDHIIVNYDFVVWTELVEQNNKVVEAINFSTEDYWGDKNRYKFRTSISDYNFETDVSADQDRIVKSTFTLMVYAYLLPDKFENYKSVVQKSFTTRKIVFDTEAIVGMENLDSNGLKKKAEEIYSKSSAAFPGLVQFANKAFSAEFADRADTALYAATASYLDLGSGSITVGELGITGGTPATGSFGTNIVTGVDPGPQPIDTVSSVHGNAALWLVSINDGTNFKTNEVAAGWDMTNINYYVTEVSQLGSVPVVLTAQNDGAGNITLVANPISGVWTIKLIRMLV